MSFSNQSSDPFSTSYRNYFPSDVLKWMKKNATPKMALKLMQICKYFQHQEFPYFVTKEINYSFDKVSHDSWWCIKPLNESQASLKEQDLHKFPNNIWAIGKISLTKCNIDILFSKITFCNISVLKIEHHIMFLSEFKFLTSNGNVKELNLTWTFIKDEKHKDVSLEGIFECLPNIKMFSMQSYIPSIRSLNTFKNALPKSEIIEIKLNDIDGSFNFNKFFTFMSEHQDFIYNLSFGYSDEELLASIKNILNNWTPKYELPMIFCKGRKNREIAKIGEKHEKRRKNWLKNNFK